jgi:predicted nucleotidyltransferase
MINQLSLLEISNTFVPMQTKVSSDIDLPLIEAKKATSKIDYKTLESALKQIFPTQVEENKTIKARRILGEVAVGITDEQLEKDLNEFQYLVDSWLDDFEMQVFKGNTLNQLLKEE